MGVVAVPVPGDARPLVPGLPLSLTNGPSRADLVVVLQSKGKSNPLASAPRGTR
jgi:hypothetical protein